MTGERRCYYSYEEYGGGLINPTREREVLVKIVVTNDLHTVTWLERMTVERLETYQPDQVLRLLNDAFDSMEREDELNGSDQEVQVRALPGDVPDGGGAHGA